MGLCIALCCALSPDSIPPAAYDYRTERSSRPPKLHSPGPAPPPRDAPPPTALTYPSAGRDLQVWVARPDGPPPHPVILFFHSGTALERSEWDATQAIVDAGYAVVAPTWRGENGNPGDHELCYGEVDDAVAAVRWAAEQPGLDPRMMFVLGHQVGGVISGFVSLYEDLPLLMTASVSAMYTQESLNDLGLPFPFVDGLRARELRVFPPFFGQPRLPHIAYLSEQDPLVAPLEELLQEASEREQIRVNMLWLSPPPAQLLEPAIDAFLQQIGD